MTEAVERAPPPARHVAAVVLGNALEFFDFLTYAFFAAQIGRTFFPSDNPMSSLLASLATFGAGFVTRPVGAFFLGRLADMIGRKPSMLISFGLMGLAMAGIGLTPGYAAIGVAAPILAIGFRLIQGFALGGEVGASTAYLIEAAPRRRRGLYVSFQYMGQDMAVLAAGMAGVILSANLSSAQLDQWGWRVPFLLGAVIVPFGLMLRRTLAETLVAEEHQRHAPGDHSMRGYVRIAILGLLLLASGTIVSYTLNYLTTYSNSILGMPETLAFGATVTNGLMGVILDPVGGALSDRFGRKPIMFLFWGFLLLTVLPAFWLIEHFRTGWSLNAATALMTIGASLGSAAILVAVTESLPARVRAGSLGLIYSISIMAFGGSAQFIITRLTDVTGNPLMPAFYMMAAVAVGFVALQFLPESAPVKVDRRAPRPAADPGAGSDTAAATPRP